MDLFIFLSCKRKTNILQNLTKENLHLNPPPTHTHTHTHTHFHHETWPFLGPSPRSSLGIIISKQKPHVNVGNSQHARIQEFLSGGGGPGQSDKKSSDNVLRFFSIYHFSRFQRGSNIFPWGGPTFSRGGGPIAYSL